VSAARSTQSTHTTVPPTRAHIWRHTYGAYFAYCRRWEREYGDSLNGNSRWYYTLAAGIVPDAINPENVPGKLLTAET
jgi:hypothetical protein